MKKFAKCTCCQSVNPVSAMVSTAMPKRGNAAAYMCSECANTNRSYHTSNNVIQGKQKVNAVNVGIELETSFTDELARNQLFEYGLIPTHDCSLNSDGYGSRYGWDGNTCEYVTGIMQGLNIASKMCVSIEKLMIDGHLKINDSCGTHFHVSIDSMKDENGEKTYMGYIRRFYHSLFIPLYNEMAVSVETTESLFGRFFDSHYCHGINENTSITDRYNFINVTNDSNIEFRLNKFNNAKQFQNLMKMEVEMVQAIVTNFCEHFNDTEIDSRRYENMTAYRKHKASMTAGKLVKIFRKYAEKMNEN